MRDLWQMVPLPHSLSHHSYQKGRLSQQLMNWRGDISITFCASVSPVDQLPWWKTLPSETSSSVLLSAACSSFCSHSFKCHWAEKSIRCRGKSRRWSLQVLHSMVKLNSSPLLIHSFSHPYVRLAFWTASPLNSRQKKRPIFQNLVLDLIQYSNYLAFTFSKENAHCKEHTRHYLSLSHISALWLTAKKSGWFVSKANGNMGKWWEEGWGGRGRGRGI